MKKITVITLAIVLVVGLFWFFNNTTEDLSVEVETEGSDGEEEIVEEVVPEVETTKVEETEEVHVPESGWQVFDGGSYEFEYPLSFYVDGCDAACIIPKGLPGKSVFVTYPAIYTEEGGMGVCGNSFEECLDWGVKTLLEKQEDIIEGQRAVRQTYISWKDWEIHEVQILNPEGDGVVKISHILSSPEYSVPTSPDYGDYFEHMISTFKFK